MPKPQKKQTTLPTVTLTPNPRRWIESDSVGRADPHPEGDGQIYLTIHCQGMDVSIEFEDIEQADAVAKALAETVQEEREARA